MKYDRLDNCVECILEKSRCEQCTCPNLSKFFEKIIGQRDQLAEANARLAELEARYERLQTFWSWGGAERAQERIWEIEQETEIARYQGLHYPNEDQINDFFEVIHNLRNRLGCGIAYADALLARIAELEVKLKESDEYEQVLINKTAEVLQTNLDTQARIKTEVHDARS